MFDLSEKELMGKQILDCPADTCSFTVDWQKKGLDITACDSAYKYSGKDLKKGFQDIDHAMVHMEKAKGKLYLGLFQGDRRS